MINEKVGGRGDVKFENRARYFGRILLKILTKNVKFFTVYVHHRTTDSVLNITRSVVSLIRYRRGFHYCYSRPAVVRVHCRE